MRYGKNKTLIIMVMTVLLMTAPITPIQAQDPLSEVSGEGMVLDFLLLRPLGLASTVIGCAFFIATLPFTVWSGKRFKQAGYNFIVEPAAYTFVRPLGEQQIVAGDSETQ